MKRILHLNSKLLLRPYASKSPSHWSTAPPLLSSFATCAPPATKSSSSAHPAPSLRDRNATACSHAGSCSRYSRRSATFPRIVSSSSDRDCLPPPRTPSSVESADSEASSTRSATSCQSRCARSASVPCPSSLI